MKRLIALLIVALLCSCGGDGEDGTEDGVIPSNDNSVDSTSSEAECYYTIDSEGNAINVGEVSPVEEENESTEEELARRKMDWFIASCNGDININITQTTNSTESTEIRN